MKLASLKFATTDYGRWNVLWERTENLAESESTLFAYCMYLSSLSPLVTAIRINSLSDLFMVFGIKLYFKDNMKNLLELIQYGNITFSF